MPLPKHHFEQLLATRVLSESAAKVSKMFDDFAVWMLAGFAALFGFAVTQHQISSTNAHQIGYCLLASAFGTAIEKYIAIVIAAGAEGETIGRKAVEELIEKNPEDAKRLDLAAFTGYVLGGLYRLPRFFAKLFSTGAENHATRGQRLLKIAQVQGIIVMISSGILLWALGTLFRAM
jgi:hypothetical protein